MEWPRPVDRATIFLYHIILPKVEQSSYGQRVTVSCSSQILITFSFIWQRSQPALGPNNQLAE